MAEEETKSEGMGPGWVSKERTIYLIGDIDETSAYRVKYALDRLGQTPEPIKICMFSPGGLLTGGWAIYDAVRQSNNYITIECYGCCMSIATLILQSADFRCLASNCVMMIHGSSTYYQADENGAVVVSAKESIDSAEQIKNDAQRYNEAMSGRSGLAEAVFEKWCEGERFFSAEEAVTFGLADLVMPHAKQFSVPKKKRKPKK